MMQEARRVAAVTLVAVALGARSARAQDAASPPLFRLFPETAAPSGPKPSVGASAPKPKKRLWLASAELFALEVLPYVHDRYIGHEDYALISWGSIRDNLQSGLSFDGDKFTTNQMGHTISGGLFFNAARTNGHSFWESAPFVLAGSYVWEMAAETQRPSLNDFVNTTLGGMVSGEATYRLSQMVLDGRARGGERVLRETAAALLNPAQFVTRLATGELWAARTERGDTLLPSGFVAETDAGWRHFVSSPRANPDQALVTLLARYGDPFERAVSRPFDSFEASLDVSAPSSAWLTRVEIRGLLGGRDLDPGSANGRHVLGFFMDFDYTNDDTRVFSSQTFRFGLLSMRPLGEGVDLRAEIFGAAAPLVALQNDHPDESHGLVGRAYDYGPGAAAFTAVRIRRDEIDLVALTYSVFWMHTSNGLARSSAVQSFHAEGRIPLTQTIALGGSWGWGRRVTSYDEFATVNVAASEGRVFLALTLR